MIEINQQQFEQAVVEASRQQPVLVDFWAPWCGPCRALGPALEQVERDYAGRVTLVKINSDENPELSARFKVRSIPLVLLFRDGAPIDQFVGARSVGQIKDFLQPHLPRPEDPFLQAAREALAAGDRSGAAEHFSAALALNPANEAARRTYVRTLVGLGRIADARHAFEPIRPSAGFDLSAAALAFLIDAGEWAASGIDAAAAHAAVGASPEEPQARFDLARVLALDEQWQAAMDQLLEVIRIDRKFRDDAARKAMLALFELCNDPQLVSAYRRKLSAGLY
ncbi:MAG: hypothetical protein RL322_1335 [Pseudomonadota bacterium]|jgi:putative thioredoxin